VALILLTGAGISQGFERGDIVEELGGRYVEKLAEARAASPFLSLAAHASQDRGAEEGEQGGPPGAPAVSGILATAGGTALLAEQSLVVDGEEGAGEVHTYEVRDGDTVSSIAKEFGISVNTVLWANDLSPRSTLRAGTRLILLPVDGVRHAVRRGDTVSSIAKLYGADEEKIKDFNDISGGALIAGETIMVPGGKKAGVAGTSSSRGSSGKARYSLEDTRGYYALPARGKITQGLHRYNAVDIGGGAYCNTPVYAAAEGKVVEEAGSGWNGGYGKYLRVSHPNGTVTLYAHASQLLVSRGESVEKGEAIALMGSTGNSTGCHVHFEVRGGRNPFAY
jgi:LysM repeat protein